MLVFQTSAPVPQKRAEIPAAAAQSQTPVNAPQNAPRNQDDQHSVSVTKLPQVSVEPDKGMWIFSSLLVVVGLLQAVILYRTWGQIAHQAGIMGSQLTAMQGQLLQMEKAAEATKIAADASMKSAQALMDGERAWLLVEKMGIADDPISAAIHASGSGPVVIKDVWLDIPGATFAVRNYGSTPGIITFIEARVELGASRDEPPNPEQVFVPGTFSVAAVASMLAKKKANLIEEHIVPQKGERIELARLSSVFHLMPEQLTRIKNDADFLWAYGVVRYQDVYDRQHETRFCYRYIVPPEEPLCHFCLRGPEQFNKAT